MAVGWGAVLGRGCWRNWETGFSTAPKAGSAGVIGDALWGRHAGREPSCAQLSQAVGLSASPSPPLPAASVCCSEQ